MAKALLFTFLLVLLVPAYALAQGDSVSAAINIVEDFHKEATILMGGLDAADIAPEAQLEKVKRELENIRRTESPGKKRFDKVYEITDGYTEGIIQAVAGLSEKRPGMKEAEQRLKDLKSGRMAALSETLRFESPKKNIIKPVPSIDGSPHENSPSGPAGPPGIWFR